MALHFTEGDGWNPGPRCSTPDGDAENGSSETRAWRVKGQAQRSAGDVRGTGAGSDGDGIQTQRVSALKNPVYQVIILGILGTDE